MIEYEPSIAGALASLAPGAVWIASNTGDFDADWAELDWISGDKPTKAAVAAEITRLEGRRSEYEAWLEAQAAEAQAEYERTEYQRLRAPEYPPLTDLADAIYWQQQGDDSKMAAYVAACEAVKAKYPKPE